MIEVTKTMKFRKGDIVALLDEDGAHYHPCLILNDDYSDSTEYGGHGQMYQIMKLSLSKPKEYSLPILNSPDPDRVSFIIPHNVYTINRANLNRGKYISYLPNEKLIDLAVEIHALRCMSSRPSSLTNDVVRKYNEYIESFVKQYGPLKDNYHDNSNFKNNINRRNKAMPTSGIEPSDVQLNGGQLKKNVEPIITIPDDLCVAYIDDVVKLAEDILTSPNDEKRAVPRFIIQWVDLDLVLYYILFKNNKQSIQKIYGISQGTAYSRMTNVVNELIKRKLLKIKK